VGCLCHGVITLSLKGWFDGVYRATAYKFNAFASLIRCEIFICNILSRPILWHSRYRWAPTYPTPSEHLTRHQSWVWLDSDITCHRTIILSLKTRSEFWWECRAPPLNYTSKTLPSFIQCEILIYDTRLIHRIKSLFGF